MVRKYKQPLNKLEQFAVLSIRRIIGKIAVFGIYYFETICSSPTLTSLVPRFGGAVPLSFILLTIVPVILVSWP